VEHKHALLGCDRMTGGQCLEQLRLLERCSIYRWLHVLAMVQLWTTKVHKKVELFIDTLPMFDYCLCLLDRDNWVVKIGL
jgi:hypothetical protein